MIKQWQKLLLIVAFISTVLTLFMTTTFSRFKSVDQEKDYEEESEASPSVYQKLYGISTLQNNNVHTVNKSSQQKVLKYEATPPFKPTQTKMIWSTKMGNATKSTKNKWIYQRLCNGEVIHKQSYCNNETMTKSGQKILTYSLFGGGSRWKIGVMQYKDSIPILANQMKQLDFYKDWIMRIYHDGSETASDIARGLSHLDNVQFCNTPCLWTVQMANILGTFFRTAALGDPMVDVLCSRDLDAIITYRESMAVKAWYETDKAIHLMRDNPQHMIRMLGGMWCFRSKLFREKSKHILHNITTEAQNFAGRNDQFIINKAFFSQFNSTDIIEHDSYNCKNFDGSLPFPAQRYECEYIGCSYIPCDCPLSGHFHVCPEECRPSGHKDWTYC